MATCAKLAAQTSSRQRGRRGKLTVKPRVGLRVVVSILGHPTPAHTNTTHARARKRMCVRLTCSLRSCATVKVLCHDDKPLTRGWGKRLWSEVNRLLVDLTFTLFLLDCSASTPSPSHPLNLKSQGLMGTQAGTQGTQENSARDSWGLRRTQPGTHGDSGSSDHPFWGTQ